MNHLIFTSTLINGYRVQTTYYVIVTANSENRKLQKYFWNVIVLQKKKQTRSEKTEPQARMLISLWFCSLFACPDLCCDWA